MHPVLLNLSGFALHTYGVLIAVGFLVGIVLAGREARRIGVLRAPVFAAGPGAGGLSGQARLLDLCFWILVSGLVGSRLLYILTNLGDYAAACREGIASGRTRELVWRCSAVLHVWEGGLVFYGGFLAALLVVAWYVRRHQMLFLRTADVLAPSLAIGHFFGRLGCYAAGCCWGKVSALLVSARFPRGSLVYEDMASRGQLVTGLERTPSLHPTQLYEAGGELAIFFLLLALRRRKRFDGQLLLAYLVAYPILRSVVELFRGDAIRKFAVELDTPRLSRWLGLAPGEPVLLSTSQLVSLLVGVGAIVLAVALRRRRQAGVGRALG
jgi:phosphatidylglycerol:prolipoprotein diacylglycerol transferase